MHQQGPCEKIGSGVLAKLLKTLLVPFGKYISFKRLRGFKTVDLPMILQKCVLILLNICCTY